MTQLPHRNRRPIYRGHLFREHRVPQDSPAVPELSGGSQLAELRHWAGLGRAALRQLGRQLAVGQPVHPPQRRPLLAAIGVRRQQKLRMLGRWARAAGPDLVRVRVDERAPDLVGVLVELEHVHLVAAVQRQAGQQEGVVVGVALQRNNAARLLLQLVAGRTRLVGHPAGACMPRQLRSSNMGGPAGGAHSARGATARRARRKNRSWFALHDAAEGGTIVVGLGGAAVADRGAVPTARERRRQQGFYRADPVGRAA
eukprot:scaffold6181_cov129-Isochrysis_galbana.AAC.8